MYNVSEMPDITDFLEEDDLNPRVCRGKRLCLQDVFGKRIGVTHAIINADAYGKNTESVTIQFFFLDDAKQKSYVITTRSRILIDSIRASFNYMPFKAVIDEIISERGLAYFRFSTANFEPPIKTKELEKFNELLEKRENIVREENEDLNISPMEWAIMEEASASPYGEASVNAIMNNLDCSD